MCEDTNRTAENFDKMQSQGRFDRYFAMLTSVLYQSVIHENYMGQSLTRNTGFRKRLHKDFQNILYF